MTGGTLPVPPKGRFHQSFSMRQSFPCKLNDKDCVFCRQTESGEKPDLEVDIIVQTPRPGGQRCTNTPSGNISKFVSGIGQLSYRAATHRKMTIMEKAYRSGACELVVRS